MPLFGSNFSSSLESRHGTMWEATRISSRLDSVTAHLLTELAVAAPACTNLVQL